MRRTLAERVRDDRVLRERIRKIHDQVQPALRAVSPILVMLVLGTVAIAAIACDTPPVAPTPLEATNTLTLGCNGRTSTAKLVDDTWEVTVVVPDSRSCVAYPCTFREAEQIQTPQEAIVECRRLYGITGSNA